MQIELLMQKCLFSNYKRKFLEMIKHLRSILKLNSKSCISKTSSSTLTALITSFYKFIFNKNSEISLCIYLRSKLFTI